MWGQSSLELSVFPARIQVFKVICRMFRKSGRALKHLDARSFWTHGRVVFPMPRSRRKRRASAEGKRLASARDRVRHEVR